MGVARSALSLHPLPSSFIAVFIINHVTALKALFKRLHLLNAAADGGGNEKQGVVWHSFRRNFFFFKKFAAACVKQKEEAVLA